MSLLLYEIEVVLDIMRALRTNAEEIFNRLEIFTNISLGNLERMLPIILLVLDTERVLIRPRCEDLKLG